MQIRRQLQRQSDAFARDIRIAVCPNDGEHRGLGRVCGLGYFHSKYVRTRIKARTRHHGNEPGQSKHNKG